jgi:hypothetical protein
MRRVLQIGGILLLVVGVSLGRDENQPKKAPPPPPAAKPKTPAAKPGTPKQQPIPKGAARAVNPLSPAARLFRMSPEDREKAIAKLPNEQRREELRKQLEWFDGLPKEAQEVQLRRLDRFEQLTPERKAEVGGLVFELNHLPPARAGAVRQALYRLQTMNDPQREKALRDPNFQARYSPQELRIINGLADAWMGPTN